MDYSDLGLLCWAKSQTPVLEKHPSELGMDYCQCFLSPGDITIDVEP